MAGKITGFEHRPVGVAGQGGAGRTAGKSSDASSAPTPSAASHVKLTDSAVQLASLERALAQVPEVDLERVQRARAEIEAGQYSIDPLRIATKLVEMDRALAEAAGKPAIDVPGDQV